MDTLPLPSTAAAPTQRTLSGNSATSSIVSMDSIETVPLKGDGEGHEIAHDRDEDVLREMLHDDAAAAAGDDEVSHDGGADTGTARKGHECSARQPTSVDRASPVLPPQLLNGSVERLDMCQHSQPGTTLPGYAVSGSVERLNMHRDAAVGSRERCGGIARAGKARQADHVLPDYLVNGSVENFHHLVDHRIAALAQADSMDALGFSSEQSSSTELPAYLSDVDHMPIKPVDSTEAL